MLSQSIRQRAASLASVGSRLLSSHSNLHGTEKVAGEIKEVIVSASDIVVQGEGSFPLESKPSHDGASPSTERRFGSYNIVDSGRTLSVHGRNANIEFGRPLDLELQFPMPSPSAPTEAVITGLAQRFQVWTDPFVKSFSASHVMREVNLIMEPPAPSSTSIVPPPRLTFMAPAGPSGTPATFYQSRNIVATPAGLSLSYPDQALSLMYDAEGGSFQLSYPGICIYRLGASSPATLSVGPVRFHLDLARFERLQLDPDAGKMPKLDVPSGILSFSDASSSLQLECKPAGGPMATAAETAAAPSEDDKSAPFVEIKSGPLRVELHAAETDHRGRVFKLVLEDQVELTVLRFRDMKDTWTQITVEEPPMGLKAHIQLRPLSTTEGLLRKIKK